MPKYTITYYRNLCVVYKCNPASHTTYDVCINFIHEWRDILFKVDSELQIFKKLSMAIFIYSQSFCPKSAEKNLLKKYFHNFVFKPYPGFEIGSFVVGSMLVYILPTTLQRLHIKKIRLLR